MKLSWLNLTNDINHFRLMSSYQQNPVIAVVTVYATDRIKLCQSTCMKTNATFVQTLCAWHLGI